jgi:hypothetical protein
MVTGLPRDTCKQAPGTCTDTPTGQSIYVPQQGLDIITVAGVGLAASPATSVERRVLVELRCLG